MCVIVTGKTQHELHPVTDNVSADRNGFEHERRAFGQCGNPGKIVL
jgi:hypothetical protein